MSITFSFGENWKDFLTTVSEDEIRTAAEDIEYWLGRRAVQGKSVLDIGSGSGIHSMAFHMLGAQRVRSFDYDRHSVDATSILWQKAGRPGNWIVTQGSILDAEFVQSLGQFDVVYSWGVLHHTGSMWQALEHAAQLVAPGGRLWVALYVKGPKYERHLALKRRYNAASKLAKRRMVYRQVAAIMLRRMVRGKNPLKWNEKKRRGMNVYHDIMDWLGGLPYEVASEDEVLQFGQRNGMELQRIEAAGEGACSTYVFGKRSEVFPPGPDPQSKPK